MSLISLTTVAFADHDINHANNKNFTINGFATIAAAKPLTTGEERSINDFLQEDDEIDVRNHNILGLRLSSDLGDKLNLTAQMVSKGVNDYDVDFDWIYAEYAISSQWHIAVGRIRTPLFMYSEFVDVGYAYQWVQAPTEIYNFVDYPFQSMESIRLRYNVIVNDWENEFLAWFGGSTDPLRTNGIDAELELEKAWGLAFTANYNWFTLRSVYFTGITSADLNSISYLGNPNPNMPFVNNVTGEAQSFFDELAELDQQLPGNISKDILWEDDRGEYISIGLAFDFDHIFINAEATHATVDSALVIPKVLAGYIMLGYQINSSWSISYTYGRDENSVNDVSWDAITNLSASNPQLETELRTFQALAQQTGEYFQDASTQSDKINVRYDFHPQAALKFEYWQEDQETPTRNNHPKGLRLGLDLIF